MTKSAEEITEALTGLMAERDKEWIGDELTITYQPADYNSISITRKGGITLYFDQDTPTAERRVMIDAAKTRLHKQLSDDAWEDLRAEVLKWYALRAEMQSAAMNASAGITPYIPPQPPIKTAPARPADTVPFSDDPLDEGPAPAREAKHWDRAPKVDDRIPGDTWDEVADSYTVSITLKDGQPEATEINFFNSKLKHPVGTIYPRQDWVWPTAWLEKGALVVDGQKHAFTEKRVLVSKRVSSNPHPKGGYWTDVIQLTAVTAS